MDACTALLLAPIPKRRDAFRVGMAYERPRILSFGAKLEFLEASLFVGGASASLRASTVPRGTFAGARRR
jgi:hypothetical protein